MQVPVVLVFCNVVSKPCNDCSVEPIRPAVDLGVIDSRLQVLDSQARSHSSKEPKG